MGTITIFLGGRVMRGCTTKSLIDIREQNLQFLEKQGISKEIALSQVKEIPCGVLLDEAPPPNFLVEEGDTNA